MRTAPLARFDVTRTVHVVELASGKGGRFHAATPGGPCLERGTRRHARRAQRLFARVVREGAPSSCARTAQLQCTESGGSKSVIGGAYRRTLRGAQRQCQRPGAVSTCRCRGTRLSRDGSAVITTTIGSPGSMGRLQRMHSGVDILGVVEQHARQTGGAQDHEGTPGPSRAGRSPPSPRRTADRPSSSSLSRSGSRWRCGGAMTRASPCTRSPTRASAT